MFDQLPDIILLSFSTTHFSDCSPNSNQSALRCESHRFLCQRCLITACLPKITALPTFSLLAPIPTLFPHAMQTLSPTATAGFLLSVSCSLKQYGNHRAWGNGCVVRIRIIGNLQCQHIKNNLDYLTYIFHWCNEPQRDIISIHNYLVFFDLIL